MSFSEQDAFPYLVASTKSSEMSKRLTFFWEKCVEMMEINVIPWFSMDLECFFRYVGTE